MSHGNTVPYIVEIIKVKINNKKGYKEMIKVLGNISKNKQKKSQSGRVYDSNYCSPSLDTCSGGNRQPKIVEVSKVKKKELDPKWIFEVDGEKYYIRIRKLTPKECFRLMGFTDEEFEKAESVNSNTQLYKQAGNSIVVDVLENIFAELFKEEIDELWSAGE